MKSIHALQGALLLLLSFGEALAVGPTYVTANITASASWTKDNSPYVIQNDITIVQGAVLTIEAGTEVRFTAPQGGQVGRSPNLVVRGGLRAIGNSAAPINFAPSAQGSLWGAIYFAGSDPSNSILQGCMIKGGRIAINQASPTIQQCAIYGAKTGVEVFANSQPTISGNRITANGYGIVLMAATASPIISGNEIYNNNFGFFFKDLGSPSITGNKIYNNLKYNMVNYSAKSVEARGNDFRAADPAMIARTIYDGAYNPSFGRVNYLGVGQAAPTVATAQTSPSAKPDIAEDEFWGYGRPFDAMKVSNLEDKKQKPSNTVKILAVGATAVVTVALLFL
jgi:parallel beta-helix repeat protein